MGIDDVMSARAVFLDRDGVINRNVFNPATGEYESPLRPEDFVLAPGALDALKKLQDAGYLLFVVSNQPNAAKGKVTMDQLMAIHERLTVALRKANITISEFYYCYHHPQGVVPEYAVPCDCRKPSPFFLLKAREKYGIDLARSWMIGDRTTDIECGHAAGVRTVRVGEDSMLKRKSGKVKANYKAKDLGDATTIVLAIDT